MPYRSPSLRQTQPTTQLQPRRFRSSSIRLRQSSHGVLRQRSPTASHLAVLNLNATASVPGTFVYSPAAGTVLTAGSHALSVTFTATDTTDYTTSTATVSIIVNQVAPVVSWSAPAAIAYGIPLGSSQPQRYRLCSRHVRLFARSGSGSDGWKPHVVGQLYSDRHNRLHRCHCNGVDFYCASRALHHLEPASGDHLRQRTWVRTVECYFLRSGCFRLHTGGWDSSDCWDPHLVGELHAN